MSTFGIVAEYNPFHNGHKLHLDMTRSSADFVVAIMSGNFVQRGECAIMPQRARAECALKCGVDLLLSLPLTAAVSGAENFAFSAIYILDALGIVDSISFGSESGNSSLLKEAANSLSDKRLDSIIKNELKSGKTYAKARQAAVEALYGKTIASFLSTPNDILGVEYIKAINKIGSDMSFISIKRQGASHDGVSVGKYKSASQIRKEIYEGKSISESIPQEVLPIFDKYTKLCKMPPDLSKLEIAVLSELRRKTADDFKKIADISEGLENKLFRAVRASSSLKEVLDNVKSKRYTHSRLRRILLCSFLGITREYTDLVPPYVRVLGFNDRGQKLLAEINKKSTLPIVTRASQVEALSTEAKNLFKLECKATDLYSLLLPKPDECAKEMTDGIIRI
ncbi:MAG: hypothetical protein BWY46_01640 [Firmicutes bacterium ADurb.Bin300]|nr:MAG: hypothetical protein BWY46_01640 [Firmicutes bacterium ADurb.Bin300]